MQIRLFREVCLSQEALLQEENAAGAPMLVRMALVAVADLCQLKGSLTTTEAEVQADLASSTSDTILPQPSPIMLVTLRRTLVLVVTADHQPMRLSLARLLPLGTTPIRTPTPPAQVLAFHVKVKYHPCSYLTLG